MPKHNLRLVSDAVAIAKEATEKHRVKKGLTLKKRADADGMNYVDVFSSYIH